MTLTACITLGPDAVSVVVHNLGGEDLWSSDLTLTSTLNDLASELKLVHFAFFNHRGKMVNGRKRIKYYKSLSVQEDHFIRWAAVNKPFGDMAKAFYNARLWQASAAKTEVIERIDLWISERPNAGREIQWCKFCCLNSDIFVQFNPNRMSLSSCERFVVLYIDRDYKPMEYVAGCPLVEDGPDPSDIDLTRLEESIESDEGHWLPSEEEMDCLTITFKLP